MTSLFLVPFVGVYFEGVEEVLTVDLIFILCSSTCFVRGSELDS